MAKNVADIYASTNDSIALEQRWYAKLEATRGTLTGPTDADFFYTLGGGSISYSQPFDSSPHRSGRHHSGIIKKKKECSFSFSTYVNIDESLGAKGTGEIDPALRLFFKSALGKEDTTGGSPVYTTATPPHLTFSLFEVGDKWARQAYGAFMMGVDFQAPGNGEATLAWSGNAAESFLVGIGKSTIANSAHTVTLQTGEGDRFPIGAIVMIVKADGTTRSSDTAAGSYRTVTAKSGDVITLSGPSLTDADGSTNPIYLSYYEPAAPTAINNPVTGLVGSMQIASTTHRCFRSFGLKMDNAHELVNYAYGSSALQSPYFVPGSRFTATVSTEMNLNDEILALFNRVQEFEAQVITFVLGDELGRHLKVEIPKVQFPVPAFAVPENGSVPIKIDGTCQQSALEAADEVTVSFL